MNESKVVAFFDFDGTITNRDIFWDFLFYRIKNGLSSLKLLSCLPDFTLYLIKVYDNEKAKQRIFSKLFKGELVDDFKAGIRNYHLTILLKRVRKDAAERLKWHQQQNHEVYIVSANFDLLLKDFAEAYHLNLICTGLQVTQQSITGKFTTPNCYGQEKVNRIKAAFPNLNSYTKIYAYGDSKGDFEMLDLATEKFYCFFKK